jgi:hypothetical protein
LREEQHTKRAKRAAGAEQRDEGLLRGEQHKKRAERAAVEKQRAKGGAGIG